MAGRACLNATCWLYVQGSGWIFLSLTMCGVLSAGKSNTLRDFLLESIVDL